MLLPSEDKVVTTAAADSKASRSVVWLVRALLTCMIAIIGYQTYRFCYQISFTREQAYIKTVKCVTDALNRERIPHWIVGGSLLGAMRLGTVVHWDPDIDIAFLTYSRSPDQEDALTRHICACFVFGNDTDYVHVEHDENISMYDLDTRAVYEYDKPYMNRICSHHLCVSLHRAVIRDNHVITKYNSAPIDQTFPLEPLEFSTLSVLRPRNATYYLDQAFGTNWREGSISNLLSRLSPLP